ncbi:MAG: flagellar protein FlgN [Clostridiales bacterium]|nr:flagellar protein FlgN [Clostridiales bacterium]
MASLIQELIQTLQSEEALYKELVPIATKKTKVIIDNDLTSLQQITDQEQFIVDKINALERKREEVVINIGTVISRNPSTLTMKKIIEMLEKQPEEQKKLSEIHDSLKSVLNTMVELNNRNKSLIQQSLEMIEFNMNLIQSTRMSPGSNNYTRGASEISMSASQTGMFDAKQ